jgi:hypothetical protein
MSDPRITYEGMNSDPGVDVSYSDIPEDSPVSFVSETGQRTALGPLSGSGEGGFGTASLAPGRYYLSVGTADDELCQTVNFYVAGAPDNL